MTAFYNEIDPFAAQWLRNLIAAGIIAPGVVDERPIQEIEAWELSGYTQCHFFAGMGVWSMALRRAGWRDEWPIWTGSCPCQPFSAAGKRKGNSDDRHLWPFWHPLIQECRPPIIVGEQVASKDGLGWLDIVSTGLEASHYAFGASDLCAAGFGEAHIRQRLYFVGLADSVGERRIGEHSLLWSEAGKRGEEAVSESAGGSAISGLADTCHSERHGLSNSSRQCVGNGSARRREQGHGSTSDGVTISGLADACEPGLEGRAGMPECGNQCAPGAGGMAGGLDNAASARRVRTFGKSESQARDEARLRLPDNRRSVNGMGNPADNNGWCGERGEEAEIGPDAERRRGSPGPCTGSANRTIRNPGEIDGRWLDADWLLCRNPSGKPSWRPVEPGTFPLAHGVASRSAKLRAIGNALDLETATAFCEAVREITHGV